MGGAILGRIRKLRTALLSLRTFYKVLGIGVLVSFIFGLVVYLQVVSSVCRLTYESLASSSVLRAKDLALALEGPLLRNDLFSVSKALGDESRSIPDFVSATVYDAEGKLKAQKGMEADAERPDHNPLRNLQLDGTVEVLRKDDVWILQISYPIRRGRLGTLVLTVDDTSPRESLAAIRRMLLISLLLCSAIGIALAGWLSLVLTRPLERLVGVVEQIGLGDFDVKADVVSSDEVGTLSLAFNSMAESLRNYKNEVEENVQLKRTLLEKVVRVQEEERRQLARELHDELGQSLSATLLHLRANCAERGLNGSLCGNIEGQLLLLFDKIHRLAWGVRPPILEECGLDNAIRDYLSEAAKTSGIQIDYRSNNLAESQRFSQEVELTVYRVTQEAILNVVKHAHAKRVSVLLFRWDGTLTLVVEDDGCGFDPLNKNEGVHLGILGMRERIASSGGLLSIESSPGKGCTIQARVPIG